MPAGGAGQKAAHHGTGAGSKKNGAKAVNSLMEHPVCKKGAIGPHIQDQPAHNAGGNEVLVNDGIILCMFQPFLDFKERMPFFGLRDDRIHIHAAVGKNNRHQGQGIHEKNGAVGKIFQKESRQKRAHHTGDVEIGGVQADGAVQRFLPHQLRHKGHAGGHIKTVDGTDEKGKEKNPAVGFMARIQKKAQKGCLNQIEKLGSHKDLPFIVLVNPESRKKGEKKTGRKLARRQKAQQEGGVRHGVHQPLLGGELEPETDKRNPLGGPEYTVIFDLQRRKYRKKMHRVSMLLIEIFLYLHTDYTTQKMLSPQGESIHNRKTGSKGSEVSKGSEGVVSPSAISMKSALRDQLPCLHCCMSKCRSPLSVSERSLQPLRQRQAAPIHAKSVAPWGIPPSTELSHYFIFDAFSSASSPAAMTSSVEISEMGV